MVRCRAAGGWISAAAAADPSAERRLVELAPRVVAGGVAGGMRPGKGGGGSRPGGHQRPDPCSAAAAALPRRRRRLGDLSARGTAHAGAAFVTVLNAITDATFTAARRAGRAEPVEAYAFDALMAIAEHAAERTTAADPEAGGDGAGSAGRAGDPGIVAAAGEGSWSGCAVRRRPSTSPRHLGLLRVDVAALRRGRVQGGELCEVAGVGPIPVSGAKEILGEAIVKLVITDGVDVLNVTHLGRGPTAAQKRRAAVDEPHLRGAGCHRARVEWDHREPWAQTCTPGWTGWIRCAASTTTSKPASATPSNR